MFKNHFLNIKLMSILTFSIFFCFNNRPTSQTTLLFLVIYVRPVALDSCSFFVCVFSHIRIFYSVFCRYLKLIAGNFSNLKISKKKYFFRLKQSRGYSVRFFSEKEESFMIFKWHYFLWILLVWLIQEAMEGMGSVFLEVGPYTNFIRLSRPLHLQSFISVLIIQNQTLTIVCCFFSGSEQPSL